MNFMRHEKEDEDLDMSDGESPSSVTSTGSDVRAWPAQQEVARVYDNDRRTYGYSLRAEHNHGAFTGTSHHGPLALSAEENQGKIHHTCAIGVSREDRLTLSAPEETRKRVMMGYRAGCQKCQDKVKGHYIHFVEA
ncbi:MAG: hypothetical protein M1824_000843 [Vezdaea acicularis]|nr:MAG: hypothetical protein M1824_000843 [Vezdaea acicularis]